MDAVATQAAGGAPTSKSSGDVDAAGADAAAAASTRVNDLSPACFVAVFSWLGAADAGRAMCVHPHWAECLGRDDSLWRRHLRDAFAQREAVLPPAAAGDSGSGGGTASSSGGQAAPSFRAAFLAWAAHFAGLPRGVTARALHAWARVGAWMRLHAPFVADSLRPGATAAQVAEAEAALGVKLPADFVAILRRVFFGFIFRKRLCLHGYYYWCMTCSHPFKTTNQSSNQTINTIAARAHDGQALEYDEAFDRFVAWRMAAPGEEPGGGGGGADGEPPAPPPRWHASMAWGAFGAYAFYDHLASLRLFPLARAVRWTRFFREHVVRRRMGGGLTLNPGGGSCC